MCTEVVLRLAHFLLLAASASRSFSRPQSVWNSDQKKALGEFKGLFTKDRLQARQSEQDCSTNLTPEHINAILKVLSHVFFFEVSRVVCCVEIGTIETIRESVVLDRPAWCLGRC